MSGIPENTLNNILLKLCSQFYGHKVRRESYYPSFLGISYPSEGGHLTFINTTSSDEAASFFQDLEVKFFFNKLKEIILIFVFHFRTLNGLIFILV